MPQQQIDEASAADLLLRYGYGTRDDTRARRGTDFSDALAEYQRRHRLKVTGALDQETRLHLSLARCSWVDQTDAERTLAMEDFLAKRRDSGAILPWFLGPIPNLGVAVADVDGAISRAFDMWEEVTPVQFPRQAQASTARLMVGWGAIDGNRGVLGRTRPGGPVQFDTGERWSLTIPPPATSNADVLTIALHEIGHAFGIGDIASDPNAVMHGFFGAGSAVIRRSFTSIDLQAIARRFGT